MFTFEIKIKYMTVTFEELLFIMDEECEKFPQAIRGDIIELSKFIKRKTIEECANKAKADARIFKASFYEFEKGEDYDAYVLKDSILNINENELDI